MRRGADAGCDGVGTSAWLTSSRWGMDSVEPCPCSARLVTSSRMIRATSGGSKFPSLPASRADLYVSGMHSRTLLPVCSSMRWMAKSRGGGTRAVCSDKNSTVSPTLYAPSSPPLVPSCTHTIPTSSDLIRSSPRLVCLRHWTQNDDRYHPPHHLHLRWNRPPRALQRDGRSRSQRRDGESQVL